jgi:outer membrane lipoprotein-sorting protein
MVYVQDSKSLLSSKVAMKFLMGVGDLREDFEVGFPDSGSRDAEGNYLMHLVPKSRESGVESILLTVDEGNFFVRKFEFSDVYGNTTTLVLNGIKINTNTNMPDDMFNFVPPPGVELYEVP